MVEFEQITFMGGIRLVRGTMKIHFGQFIHAFSDTLDLVGVDDFHHGKRVGFMALECAELLGIDQESQKFFYRAGLLHDCGVSSTRVHKKLVDELDWQDSHLHCQIGAERLSKFSPLAGFSDLVRYHHTPWRELQELDLANETKVAANLIFLADRMDALSEMSSHPNRLACRDGVCGKIAELKGSYFEPGLVDAMLAAAQKEAFWISQEADHLRGYLQLQKAGEDDLLLDDDQLKDMANLFAEVVDAKSPYTAEHSCGVTRLAGYLARRCQLPETTLARIEVAGLVHDLGKLQVPDPILESKEALIGDNLAVMRHHSYVTYMILSRISGLEEITLWASDHHEKLDGSGYPFHKTAAELGVESRVIMIADIFQALAQNRPYRTSLKAEDIVAIIKPQVRQGKLDSDIFRMVELDLNGCYDAAVSQQSVF